MPTYPVGYFDRFDSVKGYKKLLFLSGKGLQAAELNELQDGIFNELKLIASHLIRSGSIISGGEINAITLTTIQIKSGTIYADGFTYEAPTRTVPITGSGLELIGLALTEAVITENEDPLLREPDSSSPNYGQPGASRLKKSGAWKSQAELIATEDFFPIITLNNGQLVSTASSTDDQNNKINSLIGQYDNEVRGDYVLSGMKPQFSHIDGLSGNYIVTVSSGVARVGGNKIVNPSLRPINVPPLLDVRLVNSEPYTYAGSAPYTLRYNPVATIIRVLGEKQSTITLTHGVSGSADLVGSSYTPLFLIVSVTQGATTYTAGADYQLSGDTIDWSLGGAEPLSGSTYSATVRYISTFYPSIDGSGNGVELTGSDVLVTGSTFYVTYEHYLRRIDRINVSPSGQYLVSKGTPGYSELDPPQKVTGYLSLGLVKLIKNVNPKPSFDTTVNISLGDLATMRKEIADLQLNVASLALLENARSSDPTTTKRNLIVDPLYDYDLIDVGQVNTAIIIDRELRTNSTLSVGGVLPDHVTLPFTNVQTMNQPHITTDKKINPYATSSNPLIAQAELVPAFVSISRFFNVARIRPWEAQLLDKDPTLPQSTQFLVKLSRYFANETIVVEFLGTTTNVPASAGGTASVYLTVPSGTRSGGYVINATGQTSGAFSQSVFSLDVKSEVNWYDPVAQTFAYDTDEEVSRLDFRLTELPTDDILVRFVRVKLGIPDRNDVLTEGHLLREACVLGWNTVYFELPAKTLANDEYAVIIITNRPEGKVGTAKVGQYDSINAKWISSQSSRGVLLLSANQSTWSPVQDEDLTFRLYSANYTTTSNQTLMSVAAVGVSDWFLSGDVEQPQGTNVRYYLEVTSGADVGKKFDIVSDSALFTTAITGNVALKAELTGTIKKAPVLKSGLTLMTGAGVLPSIYTQRAFSIPNGTLTPATIRLIVDEYKPTSSTIVPKIETSTGVFTSMTFQSSINLGDGYNESIYEITGVGVNLARLQIVLDTSNPANRPKVRNIRITIS